MTVAEGKYDDNKGIAELQTRLKELQHENVEIEQALREIANANVLPGILQNGFDSVIAELRPLRDLSPHRDSLERPIACALLAMLTAMQGVTLTGDSLGIPPVNVPFIGEPRPDVPCEPDPYETPGKPTQQIPGGGYRP